MKKLFKLIASFQQECPVIEKKSKGYGYNYADLPSILEVIMPLLKKHNMGFTQLINGDGDNVNVKTILFESETGESIDTIATGKIENFKGMTNIQGQGSIITYLRRYSLSAILGIVTDEDIDGSIKKSNNISNNQQSNIKSPEHWLNAYTTKDKTEFTKEFRSSYKAIHEGALDKSGNIVKYTVKDIRKKYKVGKETEALLNDSSLFN